MSTGFEKCRTLAIILPKRSDTELSIRQDMKILQVPLPLARLCIQKC